MILFAIANSPQANMVQLKTKNPLYLDVIIDKHLFHQKYGNFH